MLLGSAACLPTLSWLTLSSCLPHSQLQEDFLYLSCYVTGNGCDKTNSFFSSLLSSWDGQSLRPSPLLLQRSLFQVVKIDDIDLFSRASFLFSVCFSSAEPSLINFLTEHRYWRKSFRWSELMLVFQEQGSFAHLSFSLLLLRFVPCIVVGRTHGSDEQRNC